MVSNKLKRLIERAERHILFHCHKTGSASARPLEQYVIGFLNMRENRKGETVHETKAIHTLAFILAFEELEREKQITIDRHGLPICMTDNETVFKLTVKEGL